MEKEKSNKKLYVIITILVILVLAMGGFIVYKEFINNKNDSNNTKTEEVKENNTNTEESISKIDSSKDWVFDAEYKNTASVESYTVYETTTYAKDIKVPYLNVNSDYAKASNVEIEKIFNKAVSAYNNGVNYDETLEYLAECDYQKTITSSYISTIITLGIGGTDVIQPEYYAYNIDLKTGKELSYQEVYELAGFTSDNIEEKVEKAISDYVTKVFDEDAQYLEDEEESIDTYIDDSVNDYKESLKDGKIIYFIDNNKKLNIVTLIELPFGTGEFDRIITIE